MSPRPQGDARAPNDTAFRRLLAVEPQWQALVAAGEATGLADRTLLHAGPPLDGEAPPTPILNAAVIACLYEGWADDQARAERLVRSGHIRLRSAQDHGVVTPLAAVVSPSMPLQAVADGREPGRVVYSPLSSGAGPQLRFGARDPDIIERLRWRERILAEVLRRALAEPIALLPIAVAAMAEGDELHGRTAAATLGLRQVLADRIGDLPAFGEVQSLLDRSPLFFLSLWMAACKCILSAAEGAPGSSLVTAMAGNGRCFGIQLAGLPGVWFTAAAVAPEGPRLDVGTGAPASGAIGDSAVIDALGFGGQAMSLAPDVVAMLGAFVPEGAADLPDILLIGEHPAFGALRLRVGLDARRILVTRAPPVVTLSMIDATGQVGLIGRGTFRPPLALFERACRSLDSGSAAVAAGN